MADLSLTELLIQHEKVVSVLRQAVDLELAQLDSPLFRCMVCVYCTRYRLRLALKFSLYLYHILYIPSSDFHTSTGTCCSAT